MQEKHHDQNCMLLMPLCHAMAIQCWYHAVTRTKQNCRRDVKPLDLYTINVVLTPNTPEAQAVLESSRATALGHLFIVERLLVIHFVVRRIIYLELQYFIFHLKYRCRCINKSVCVRGSVLVPISSS